jgi:2'-5' RNA ligase
LSKKLKSENLYFLGLLPPVEIQSEITKIKEFFREKYGIDHALKSPPHITLIPPFKKPEMEEGLLVNGLKNFTQNESSFPVTLENFGAFPPMVIFIDIRKNDSLAGLYHRITKNLIPQWKIIPEENRDRPFNPHLTVAFRDLRKEQFHDAWPQFKSTMIRFEFVATGITLLKHNGKIWSTCLFSPFTRTLDK